MNAIFFSDFLDFKVILLIYLRLLPVKIHIPLKSEKKKIFYPFILTPSSPKNSFACRLLLTSTFTSSGKKIKGEKWLLLEWLITFKKNTREREFLCSQLNLTFPSVSVINEYPNILLFSPFFFFSIRVVFSSSIFSLSFTFLLPLCFRVR